ncbi:SDR family NAD(P)-dependent oxidoreductase [Microbacterium sp. STN6]|uniref:SDR family oxidoreductase n=1 Tax=Microbacterium sp. STN6 TaxID=2995588 RepID=UPI002260F62F|nr:SDR family NAD(P)-dependent oxidoreductase [Microbacterium sp. STN6]MCX7521958.1 SDR family NAD(P)-dependent oxidoreductase [Microbacterium sp. STN6]
MNTTNNTIFIPGATSGLGLALALSLQAKGNTVIVGGRRVELLESIAREHPGIDTVEIDTADAASIGRAAEKVLAAHPRLNVLVTMAGIMRAEDWHSPAGFVGTAEQIVTTNLLGPIRLIGAFIEHLQAQADAAIVTVSSGLAFVPLAATPSYNASKAAIHMLSEGVRLQLADTSVRVIELVPPAVRTALMPGQEQSPVAMPLDEFIAEAAALLDERLEGEAGEVLVEGVKLLRFAETRGDYDAVVSRLNATDPHSRAS